MVSRVKVFISWSGKKSRDVARVLGGWLPSVLHAVEPFVSAKDIRAGTRWQAEIATELDDTDFGLICVTTENQGAEWLNFEAGALAKSVDSSRVVPLAIDLAPADIVNPLGQFQAIRLHREDIAELLVSLNESCSSAIAPENLTRAIEKWWPDLQAELEKISERTYEGDGGSRAEPRPDRELLEEVLDAVRTMNRGRAAAPRRIAVDRADELLEEVLSAGPDQEWRIQPQGADRIRVAVENSPSEELRAVAAEIESRLGIEVEFEPI
jgi:hypothetical protein